MARNGALMSLYTCRGRKSLPGNVRIAHSKLNTPPTAMPTIRNGSKSSHTIG
jgi:hypothetical protein